MGHAFLPIQILWIAELPGALPNHPKPTQSEYSLQTSRDDTPTASGMYQVYYFLCTPFMMLLDYKCPYTKNNIFLTLLFIEIYLVCLRAFYFFNKYWILCCIILYFFLLRAFSNSFSICISNILIVLLWIDSSWYLWHHTCDLMNENFKLKMWWYW